MSRPAVTVPKVKRVGWAGSPAQLSAEQHRRLSRLVDALIPAGGGFPAASEAGVVDDFIARWLGEPASQSTDMPSPECFIGTLDSLTVLDGASDTEISDLVSTMVSSESEFIRCLIELTYYGYYSRADVVREIGRQLPGAGDYRLAPQPEGYRTAPQIWAMPTRQRGTYTPTFAVTRVVQIDGGHDRSR